MKETIKESVSGDSSESNTDNVTIKEIIVLLMKFLFGKINSQRLLYMLSFLTFGIGDGVTAVYMMEKTSTMREANPMIRFMYADSGKQGVIIFKIWYTLMVLILVWMVSRKTNTYWTINGFLLALTIGGGMAIRANMMAASGQVPPAPEYIISTYLFMIFLFMMIGDLLDKLQASR